MELAILVENVWKSYGSVAAVHGLDVNAPIRSVYGFLGPKSAGKSTTIRMALGLQGPDRRCIKLFGHSFR